MDTLIVQTGPPAPGTLAPAPRRPTLDGPVLVALQHAVAACGVIRMAELLARRDGVPARVMALVPPARPPDASLDDADVEALLDGRRLRVRARLRHLVRDVVGREHALGTGIVSGTSARAFGTVVGQRRAGLVMVPLDDPGAPDRIVTERDALQIARLVDVPVLAIPTRPSALPSRALACVDGSAASLRAARAALRLLTPGATLILAHVAREPEADAPAAGPQAGWLEHAAGELSAASAAVAVETTSLRGEPATALLELAERRGVELIAAGTSGAASPARDPRTSDAAALLAGAPHAVLLARPPLRRRATRRPFTQEVR